MDRIVEEHGRSPRPLDRVLGRLDARTPALILATCACLATPVLVLLEVHSPLRTVAGLLFFTLTPGAAVLLGLKPARVQSELALLVGTSLAVTALVGQLMLWLGAWGPSIATYAVAVLCAPSLFLQLAGVRRG